VQWPKEKTRDRLATYNLKSRDDLAALTPDFNWSVYLEAAGLGGADELVIATPSFFEAFATMFPTISVSDWKQYLKYKLASYYAYQLGQDFFDVQFGFYGKTLRGQEEPRERWQYALSQINNLLGDAMGRIYLEKYFPEEAKQRTEAMVENLRAAFADSIDGLEWMSPETKAGAHKKLASLRVYVGYPGYWRDYTDLEIRADDMLGNTMRGQAHSFRSDVEKLQSGPIDGEFMRPTQTFNAYYSPTAGELVFLAGFLQPPMFDPDAEDAVNYGAIGRVIGHEISHAFDDQGRKVDENGENRDWWAPQDAEKYEALAQIIVEQYAQFEPLEGMHINGELTLGENIADLAGVIVAYRAYLKSLDGKQAPVIDGFTGQQRFFIGAAQINRSMSREGALREQLLSDPHSPSEYRTSGVMPNIPEFYDVWDVKEGDDMYKAPEDRVVIW
jgi:endothelin-converting enzyme/putative endopeptidase